jgi:hypothetical protein
MDWLILELDKLLRIQGTLEDVRDRARDKRGTVTFFLGLLVVYLAAVAVVATLT